MRHPPVDDVGRGHSALDRAHARLELGDHPGVDAGEQAPGPAHVETGEQRVPVGPVGIDALDVGEDDELVGSERDREGRRRRVGVDVEHLARVVEVGDDRRDDGDAAGGEEVVDRRGVDLGDIAHETEVDLDPVLDEASARAAEEARVLAREPDGQRAVVVEETDELAAHLSDEDHPDDVHGLRRRHAQAAAELALDAEAPEHGPDLRAAAVDDDRPQPGVPEEGDVLGEGRLERLVGHRVAAVLDDDERAVEALQPRQRLDEGGGLGLGVGEVVRAGVGVAHVEYALFSWT